MNEVNPSLSPPSPAMMPGLVRVPYEDTILVREPMFSLHVQVFVRKVIELHDKNVASVNVRFMNHSLFHKALKEAFEVFCNQGVAGSSSAELLAIHDHMLQPVIGLLSFRCSESQKEAALLIGKIVATDSDCTGQRGAVKSLIEILHSTDVLLREISAFALERLASDFHQQAGFASMGGLIPLLKLLDSTKGSLQLNAAFAGAGKTVLTMKLINKIAKVLGGLSVFAGYGFQLEYTTDCERENGIPFTGHDGFLPTFVSLSNSDCKNGEILHGRLGFYNAYTVVHYYHPLGPQPTPVSEGVWDSERNRLSLIACRFLTCEPYLVDVSVDELCLHINVLNYRKKKKGQLLASVDLLDAIKNSHNASSYDSFDEPGLICAIGPTDYKNFLCSLMGCLRRHDCAIYLIS